MVRIRGGPQIDQAKLPAIEAASVLVSRLQEDYQAKMAAAHESVTDGVGLTQALAIEYDLTGKPVRFTGAAERRGIGKAMALNVMPDR